MSDNREYLGDGVYARFDGFGVMISVDHHLNELVYLEPDVLEKLLLFYNKKKKCFNEK